MRSTVETDYPADRAYFTGPWLLIFWGWIWEERRDAEAEFGGYAHPFEDFAKITQWKSQKHFLEVGSCPHQAAVQVWWNIIDTHFFYSPPKLSRTVKFPKSQHHQNHNILDFQHRDQLWREAEIFCTDYISSKLAGKLGMDMNPLLTNFSRFSQRDFFKILERVSIPSILDQNRPKTSVLVDIFVRRLFFCSNFEVWR